MKNKITRHKEIPLVQLYEIVLLLFASSRFAATTKEEDVCSLSF